MIEKMGKLSRMEPNSLSCLDVVRCIHGLTDTDIKTLESLPSTDGITAHDVGEAIGKDRSTAHRSLEKLVSAGICFKEKRSGTPRGYSNYYQRISTKDLYKMTEKSLDECYAKVKVALDNVKDNE